MGYRKHQEEIQKRTAAQQRAALAEKEIEQQRAQQEKEHQENMNKLAEQTLQANEERWKLEDQARKMRRKEIESQKKQREQQQRKLDEEQHLKRQEMELKKEETGKEAKRHENTALLRKLLHTCKKPNEKDLEYCEQLITGGGDALIAADVNAIQSLTHCDSPFTFAIFTGQVEYVTKMGLATNDPPNVHWADSQKDPPMCQVRHQ